MSQLAVAKHVTKINLAEFVAHYLYVVAAVLLLPFFMSTVVNELGTVIGYSFPMRNMLLFSILFLSGYKIVGLLVWRAADPKLARARYSDSLSRGNLLVTLFQLVAVMLIFSFIEPIAGFSYSLAAQITSLPIGILVLAGVLMASIWVIVQVMARVFVMSRILSASGRR